MAWFERLPLLKALRGAVIAAALALPSSAAYGQTFDFTPDQFERRLNQAIAADTQAGLSPNANTIKACRANGAAIVCTFNDAGFQHSVDGMRKLGLLNARVSQKLLLTISVQGGRVSQILLAGNRGDPANMFQFISYVLNVVETFDSAALKENGAALTVPTELGIMRGDDAADIGKPVVTVKNYALIRCLTVPSSISTEEACSFVPRS